MRWPAIGLVAVLAAGALAGCGGDGQGTAAAAGVEATASLDPSASAAPSEEPTPPPPVNYTYQAPADDLCPAVLTFPPLLAHYDEVARVDLPANPLQCSLDLHTGDDAHLLDIKIQLDQSEQEIYIWHGVDAAMGTLVPVVGIGQGGYYFDTDLGRTLVVRDANVVARLMLMNNVNSGGAPATDTDQVLLVLVAQQLLNQLRA